MDHPMQQFELLPSRNLLPVIRQAVGLRRRCACGSHTGGGGQCGGCRQDGELLRGRSGRASLNPDARRHELAPQRAILDEEVPIHRPLIERYRRGTGQPEGGVDPSGMRVGPTDAELKYSGLLGVAGSGATWRAPVINRRNAAEVYFNSTPLIDPPGGLTTQFINGRAIHSNVDVSNAIPRPAVRSRSSGGTTHCWFERGVSITGRTTMDIFSSGPWRFRVTGEQADNKFASPKCTGRTDPTEIRVAGFPSDQALEEYIRLGELEHEQDSEAAFNATLGQYARNVNNLVGDTPTTRMSGSNLVDCTANLRRLENRGLLTDFVLQLNAATDRRHAGGRHSSAISGLVISSDCSTVTATMDAGTL